MKKLLILFVGILLISTTSNCQIIKDLSWKTPLTVISGTFSSTAGVDTTIYLRLLENEYLTFIVSSATSMTAGDATVKFLYSNNNTLTSANFAIDTTLNVTLADAAIAYKRSITEPSYKYIAVKVSKGSNTAGAYRVDAYMKKPTK